VPRVRQEDIDAAKRNIETDLLTSAEEELSTFVAAKNEREQSDLAVLLGEKFLEKEVLDIVIEDSILGTSKESFFISAKLKVRTWAYSRSDLYNLLWNELSAKTDRRMKLVDIDINIDSLDLLERNEASGFLKVSVAARGAQEFIINPRSEAGIIFVNEIKSQTAGIGAADAESIILNREEVADVYISVWPFWSSKIPSLPENISVTLLQDASEN
jgi:hypothetical protein